MYKPWVRLDSGQWTQHGWFTEQATEVKPQLLLACSKQVSLLSLWTSWMRSFYWMWEIDCPRVISPLWLNVVACLLSLTTQCCCERTVALAETSAREQRKSSSLFICNSNLKKASPRTRPIKRALLSWLPCKRPCCVCVQEADDAISHQIINKLIDNGGIQIPDVDSAH